MWWSFSDLRGFPPLPHPGGGAVCGGGLCGGRRGRGFPPPFFLGCCGFLFPAFPVAGWGGPWVWFSDLSCCGCLVVAVAVPVVVPLAPFPLPPSFGSFFLPPVVSASAWLVARLFPGGGECRRVRGIFCSSPSAAAWSWSAALSGWVSSGWADWSLGVPSAGFMGVAFGVAWLGGCPPRWTGCAAWRSCDCPSRFPSFPLAGWCALVGWSGPFGCFLFVGGWGFPPSLFFFLLRGGDACSSLCPPWAGARSGLRTVWLTGLLFVLPMPK